MKSPINRTEVRRWWRAGAVVESVFNRLRSISPEFQLGANSGRTPDFTNHGLPLTLPLHNPDFLIRQPVKLIHQVIDLPVGGLDLALERCLGLGDFGLVQLPV